LQELLNQSDNLQKQIEALKTHVEECVDELSDPLDGVVKTCETSKESVS